MASSNRAVWLLLLLGLAGGAGFVVLYFLVLTPAGERGEARHQITEWGERKWQPLRSCLFGQPPRAARGRDGLLLRAALTTGGLPPRRACNQAFVDLRRPGTSSSGDNQIERGWKELERASSRLANAYLEIDYTDPAVLARIGEAIDGVQTAYTDLRHAAGMGDDPPPGPESFPALPKGTLLPEPARGLQPEEVRIAGETVLFSGALGDATSFVAVSAADRAVVEPDLGGDLRLAADDQRWGLWTSMTASGDGELTTGAVDADRNPAGAGTVLIKTHAGTDLAAPLFALGNGPTRVAVYELAAGTTTTMWTARSADGGATFTERVEVSGDDAGIAFRPSVGQRRFDAFWRDAGGIHWLGLGADAATAALSPRLVFARPDGDPHAVLSCHGGNADWMVLDGSIVRSAAGGEAAPVGEVTGLMDVLGCDADHLVLQVSQRNELAVCQPAGCKVMLNARSGPGSSLVAAWGSRAGLIAATTAGDLLVLWREGRPSVYRMADDQRILQAVVEWNGVTHLLIEVPADGIEVVRVP